MTKKELKQKISETFANDKIEHKPQYIRDLIDENVNDGLVIVNELDIDYYARKIELINNRQINGYETFRINNNNLKLLREEIKKQRWAIIFSVVFFVVSSVVIQIIGMV